MIKRDLPNKDTKGKPSMEYEHKPEFIDPNARHPALGDAEQGTATKAKSRRATVPEVFGPKGADVHAYTDRALHLYGEHDSRRIVANPPMGAKSAFPAGGDRTTQ